MVTEENRKQIRGNKMMIVYTMPILTQLNYNYKAYFNECPTPPNH